MRLFCDLSSAFTGIWMSQQFPKLQYAHTWFHFLPHVVLGPPNQRLAILEAEEREKQLRLLDEVHLRAAAAAAAAAAVDPKSDEPGGAEENAPPEEATAVETLRADDEASGEGREQGQAQTGAGGAALAFRAQGAGGDESDQPRVDPKEMDVDRTDHDHPTGGSVDPSSVGDDPGGIIAGNNSERRGGEEEGGTERPRPPPLEREQGQTQEQERREEPAEGARKEKKGGKRARDVIGVVVAAAYYAVWAVVALVLG